MKMSGDVIIPAPREKVWDALNDAQILQRSIKGAETVVKKSDTDFVATVRARVGPVSARFTGNITLSELNPPTSCLITGKGTGGIAGRIEGTARITLTQKEDNTHLSYTVDAKIRGKLAQLGQRLLLAAAKKMADSFFATFTQNFSTPQKTAGLPSWAWGTALIVFILLLLYLTAHPFP